jgi:hypothetical protein
LRCSLRQGEIALHPCSILIGMQWLKGSISHVLVRFPAWGPNSARDTPQHGRCHTCFRSTSHGVTHSSVTIPNPLIKIISGLTEPSEPSHGPFYFHLLHSQHQYQYKTGPIGYQNNPLRPCRHPAPQPHHSQLALTKATISP